MYVPLCCPRWSNRPAVIARGGALSFFPVVLQCGVETSQFPRLRVRWGAAGGRLRGFGFAVRFIILRPRFVALNPASNVILALPPCFPLHLSACGTEQDLHIARLWDAGIHTGQGKGLGHRPHPMLACHP